MNARHVVKVSVGCALLCLAWEALGRFGVLGRTFPALSHVLLVFDEAPRRALLLRSGAATLNSAVTGYASGISLGVGVALLAHLVPLLRGGLERLAVLVNALPVIAIAPVLIITAGREDTPAVLACIPVSFIIYGATGVGLSSAGERLDMLLKALGANRWQRLVKLEAIAALPHLLRGMKLSAGSAMIGAIIGEWFGAPSGLGVVVLNSMQNFQIPLLWAACLVITALTLAAYGLLTLGERIARAKLGECGG